MATASNTASSSAMKPDEQTRASEEEASRDNGRYVLPLIHTSVPASVVNVGFWGALVGSVALGAVDPPLGLLVGAGVIVARHRPRSGPS